MRITWYLPHELRQPVPSDWASAVRHPKGYPTENPSPTRKGLLLRRLANLDKSATKTSRRGGFGRSSASRYPSRASSHCLFRPSVGSGDGEGRQARAIRTHALAGMSSQSQRGRSRARFVRSGILPLVFSGCEPHTVPRADASSLFPGHSRNAARIAVGPWTESPTHLMPFFLISLVLGSCRWTASLGWRRGGLFGSLLG